MRPKFVFALLLLALLVLAGVFPLKWHLGNGATAPAAIPAPADSNAGAGIVPPSAPPPVPAASAATNTLTAEHRQAAIDAETDRLQEWSMDDDPASLANILADLTNPEKEIRDAAIEAAKQFGSTNAISTLKAVAANTTDTEEQIALLEAANFLSLPALELPGGPAPPRTPEQIQADEQRRAERQARHQARMQRHAPSQNSPSAPDPGTAPPADPNSSGPGN